MLPKDCLLPIHWKPNQFCMEPPTKCKQCPYSLVTHTGTEKDSMDAVAAILYVQCEQSLSHVKRAPLYTDNNR